MHSLNELKFQLKQDIWADLYFSVASQIVDADKIKGRTVLHRAVKKMGDDLADLIRPLIREQTLNSIYRVFPGCTDDVRHICRILCKDDDKYRWFTDVCPFAKQAQLRGDYRIGEVFCEVFHRSVIMALTGGNGQVNLSSRLTNPVDFNCSFSVYARRANMALSAVSVSDADKREDSLLSAEQIQLNYPSILGVLFLNNLFLLADTDQVLVGIIADGLEDAAAASRQRISLFMANTDAAVVSDAAEASLFPRGDGIWQTLLNKDLTAILHTNYLSFWDE
jgi:hypothetical protein